MINGTDILRVANDGIQTKLYESEVLFLESIIPPKNYMDFNTNDQRRITDLFFLPDEPESHSFKRFESFFRISSNLLSQNETMKHWVDEMTVRDFLIRSKELGLSYVEFTRSMSPPPLKELREFDALKRFENEAGVHMNYNIAFIRLRCEATNRAYAQALIELLQENSSNSVVGIAMFADETNAPALEQGQSIYVPLMEAVDSGKINLYRTMHSGEFGDVR